MKVLVTGTAGFIGSHVAQALLARGDEVVGFDNLNDYYDVTLKQARLDQLSTEPNYVHHTLDLADREGMAALFAKHRPRRIALSQRQRQLPIATEVSGILGLDCGTMA